jgi:hypothetical protein
MCGTVVGLVVDAWVHLVVPEAGVRDGAVAIHLGRVLQRVEGAVVRVEILGAIAEPHDRPARHRHTQRTVGTSCGAAGTAPRAWPAPPPHTARCVSVGLWGQRSARY